MAGNLEWEIATMREQMTQIATPRKFPMRKPDNHQPVIQRYSSQVSEDVSSIRVATLGFQGKAGPRDNLTAFLDFIDNAFAKIGKPNHHDIANFVDTQGYSTAMAVCYWLDEDDYSAWLEKFDLWWGAHDPEALENGLWFESFSVPPPYRETNLFQEYLRGVSACPMTRIEPMSESGYWGAARDRFSASAHDDFSPEQNVELQYDPHRDTLRKHIKVSDIPSQLCVIRSGVTWANCGEEQLESYETNLKPKLDKGMTYLRENPVDTGCCSLRQVTCLEADGSAQEEAYSLGIFLTYRHLERWAHDHPTHLAIYTRALAERKKYQENLELLTYHEICVLNEDVRFEYINCHPDTGLLPYFTNNAADQ
ncbi:phenylacetaldoxime dehydratase family protein [Erythrobacter sp.]|uniref:phenylacetaldoxime dehydratase family protein n=1 Tax=Erythrobacter sp. TaxID=1042 RepID=UPI003298D2AD